MNESRTLPIALGIMLMTVGVVGLAPNAAADHPPVADADDCLSIFDNSGAYAEVCYDVTVAPHYDLEDRITEPAIQPKNLGQWVNYTETTVPVPLKLCPSGEDECIIDTTVDVPIFQPSAQPQFEPVEVTQVTVQEVDPGTSVQPTVDPHPENVERDVCTTGQAVCDLVENPPTVPDVPNLCGNDGCSTNPCENDDYRIRCAQMPEIQFADADQNGRIDGLLVDYSQFDDPVFLTGDLLDDNTYDGPLQG
jgi:hypothetical protein